MAANMNEALKRLLELEKTEDGNKSVDNELVKMRPSQLAMLCSTKEGKDLYQRIKKAVKDERNMINEDLIALAKSEGPRQAIKWFSKLPDEEKIAGMRLESGERLRNCIYESLLNGSSDQEKTKARWWRGKCEELKKASPQTPEEKVRMQLEAIMIDWRVWEDEDMKETIEWWELVPGRDNFSGQKIEDTAASHAYRTELKRIHERKMACSGRFMSDQDYDYFRRSSGNGTIQRTDKPKVKYLLRTGPFREAKRYAAKHKHCGAERHCEVLIENYRKNPWKEPTKWKPKFLRRSSRRRTMTPQYSSSSSQK